MRRTPLRDLISPTWALIPALALLAFGLYREAYLKFLIVSSPAVSLLLARAVLGPASWLQARDSRKLRRNRGRRPRRSS